jgi:hypothetical protein
MKRLISLVLLFACSFTFCATLQGQTWRLTNDASNSAPRIILDKQHHAWVQWLFNVNGSNEVCYRKYSGTWSVKEWLTNDPIDQIYCDIACNPITGKIYAVWDSVGKIQCNTYDNDSGWTGQYNIIDSVITIPPYSSFGKISIAAGDSGCIFLSWTANDTGGYFSVYMMRNIGMIWYSPERVLQGDAALPLYEVDCYASGVSVNRQQYPSVLCRVESGHMGGFHDVYLCVRCWLPDSGWMYRDIAAWSNHSQPNNVIPVQYDAGFSEQGDLHVISAFADTNNVMSLSDTKYLSNYDLDTTYQIYTNIHPQNAVITSLSRPTVAWSDSHSVFLNTFYDTAWSHPPVRISDTALHNCINPDIVAENDSTVWVCYQNDGDIYVTRSSVPLGVTGKPNTEYRISRPISLKSWPNPANNVIHFPYSLFDKRNSSV